MSRQTFPTWVDQPGCIIHNFRIIGASVGATLGTAGLDGRGANLCTISAAANVVTIKWNVAFGDIPYINFQPSAGQNDTLVQIVTSTTQQLVFNTVQADSNGTGVNNANIDVTVFGYNTTSFVS